MSKLASVVIMLTHKEGSTISVFASNKFRGIKLKKWFGNHIGLMLMLPAFAYINLLVVIPGIIGVRESFFRQIQFFARDFVGWANYIELFSDADFLLTFRRNFIWVGATLIPQMIVGTFVALILNRTFIFRRYARAIVLFAWAVPTIAAGIMWRWIFDSSFGILNYGLSTIGLLNQPIPWLGLPKTALVSVIIVGIWKYYPFVTINVLARLQMIPESMLEAARIDGASEWQVFWYIILPQLKSILLVIGLLRFLYMFPKFDVIWVLTQGGPFGKTEILATMVYRTAFRSMEMGKGAAISTVILFILILGTTGFVITRNTSTNKI